MNVDVEIYMKTFINFFENNPNDLMDLIGDKLKEKFYDRVKNQALKNIDKGEDPALTRPQLIDIVVNLRKGDVPPTVIEGIMEKNKFGSFCLN